MNYLGSWNQPENLMYESSNKVAKPYVFRANDLCMFASWIDNEEGQAFEVVMKINEDDINMLWKSIIEEHNRNFVTKGDEA